MRTLRQRVGAALWIDDVASLQLALEELGRPRKRLLGEAFEMVAESASKGRDGRVLNALTAGLVLDRTGFMRLLRKRGLLRPSKYDFLGDPVVFACERLVNDADTLALEPDDVAYFASVRSLAELASELRSLVLQIRKRGRADRGVIGKGLMAALDLRFMDEIFFSNLKGMEMESPSNFSNEELAAGFSYVVHELSASKDIDDETLMFMDAERVAAGEYDDTLCKGAAVRRFMEWEVLVDALGYVCEYRQGDERAKFRAPRPEIERALRLGFITPNLARNAFSLQLGDAELMSLDAVAAGLYSIGKETLVERVRSPIDRFRFKFPVVEGPLKEMLGKDSLFYEEAAHLQFLQLEHPVNARTILQFELAEGVTCLDIMKVQRLVNLVRFIVAFQLGPYRETNSSLVVQSLIPRLPHDDLVRFFSTVVSEEKAQRIIALLDWRSTGGVFDVLYQPLLRGEHVYLLPTNVFGASSIIRNAMQLMQRRMFDDGAIEPVSAVLHGDLEGVADHVEMGVDYVWDGKRGEIDVVAMVDGVLFAFECKQPLAPTGMHELRTTIDALEKAGDQLDRLRSCFDSSGFREYLSEKLGWPVREEVVTCIVNGNRLFAGSGAFRHPVRSSFELSAFLGHGRMQFGPHEILVRRAGRPSAGSLRRYLEENTVHRVLFEAMPMIHEETAIGDVVVAYETYVLDMVAVCAGFGLSISREAFEAQLREATLEANEAREKARERAREVALRSEGAKD